MLEKRLPLTQWTRNIIIDKIVMIIMRIVVIMNSCYIYIYIYIERERERYREMHTHISI